MQPVANIGGGGSQNADVQFLINGPDLAKLDVTQPAARREASRRCPAWSTSTRSLNAGKPELSVQVDRPKAADLGVQIGDAAEALRLLVGGDQVTTYNEGGEQYEVHLRARAERPLDRSRRSRALTVPSSRLGSVSLDNVADFSPGPAPSDINRLARQRQVTVFANLLPTASQVGSAERHPGGVRAAQAGADYRGAFTGRSKELGRAAQNFVLAFVLSLVFMYLILAAQFESWLHPITILLSLPLTLPFALLSIIIFQQSLNIFSALGLLVLFGVVKKNSILQIDHANQLQGDGPVDARRRRPGQPRPAAADSDDDLRVRGRHDSAHRLERHRLRHQPRDRLRHLRRPVARAAAHAARHAGGLLAVRRCLEGARRLPRAGGRTRRTTAADSNRACSRALMRNTVLSCPYVAGLRVSRGRLRRPQATPATAAADRRRSGADGARATTSTWRRPARSADQRHARRGGGRRCSGRRSAPACSATTSCSRRPASWFPTATRNDVVTSNVGLNQRLPWFGTLVQRVVGHRRTPTATAS